LDLVLADADPVDLPADANADTLVSPQIELGALDGRVELDRTGDTLDRQVARHPKLRSAEGLDVSRLERDLGVGTSRRRGNPLTADARPVSRRSCRCSRP